jgi:hypothetical protein
VDSSIENKKADRLGIGSLPKPAPRLTGEYEGTARVPLGQLDFKGPTSSMSSRSLAGA